MLAPPGPLGRHLGASDPSLPSRCPSINAKIANVSPTDGQDGASMAQYGAKMSQHGLQEHPRDPKKPSKVLYCHRFFDFGRFYQDRNPNQTKITKMIPKAHQVAHLRLQAGHLGHILVPSWPTRHIGPTLDPSWRQDKP